MRRLAKKAKEQIAARPNFFTKHLNIWVTAESAWMDMDRWDKCADIASDDIGDVPINTVNLHKAWVCLRKHTFLAI